MDKNIMKYIVILFIFRSCPINAMKQYTLNCQGRSEMTVMHTNYRITTLKWDDDFIVSPSPTKLFNKNEKKLVYQFMNGDMMIVNSENEKHYFIYNQKKEVECHKGPDKNVFPVILGITH
ncbi:hypothetical protein C5467_09485 [Photorhabdus khanii subsp. guanajuatensis]|uniref:C-type lysozyme inhibitor domain-containing protein n=2 Tax=Photorhabdus khanii TaxID=1004150 RepID=A0A4R4JYK2_9GAMM|nr:hypothetical protein C5467_09485 [Photorhabdus khanii subsp. guanajuatensis]